MAMMIKHHDFPANFMKTAQLQRMRKDAGTVT
ncbi:hypothetical protein FHR83_009335 [Actinoplanes campanulatus]|uniref:Uncharacterized protein n=1 Tax=Actinoplanes campanulatus TaxID=113559 RepID=A0A7W5FKE0_9ACTN|nr:hypothetical protein [Actinoplanes campanulatus]